MFVNDTYGFMMHFQVRFWRYLDFHIIPAQQLTDQTAHAIGEGRFSIWGGGQGLEYWGGGKFPAGTWRRNDVDAT